MSWKVINKLLIRAIIDARFARKLLADPLAAVHEVELEITPEEQNVLRNARVEDLSDLSQLLINQLEYDEE
ncbi:hypothetical protein KDA_49950 [Dictyobacter alpinus]|uniref:Uncharacterized protein n=1 Tax=Dictyobacter alpinus TaxID=2014873 RepID=A0A402BDL3_9CHLR|nr:Os1348 family NHLP clan protein [Dictyobacter alpinus]GCE29294.1 hypothetical protein KDA_47780 [Dictyobacter alpinus]GCE29511.1 hypothetical protein KDA_49950 [Dictyobacter alpinus]